MIKKKVRFCNFIYWYFDSLFFDSKQTYYIIKLNFRGGLNFLNGLYRFRGIQLWNVGLFKWSVLFLNDSRFGNCSLKKEFKCTRCLPRKSEKRTWSTLCPMPSSLCWCANYYITWANCPRNVECLCMSKGKPPRLAVRFPGESVWRPATGANDANSGPNELIRSSSSVHRFRVHIIFCTYSSERMADKWIKFQYRFLSFNHIIFILYT